MDGVLVISQGEIPEKQNKEFRIGKPGVQKKNVLLS